RRIMRFIRSLLPAAPFSNSNYKRSTSAIDTAAKHYNLLVFVVNHLPHFTATYTADPLGFAAGLSRPTQVGRSALMTASARRDKQLFRWNRRCAGSGGCAIALLAGLAVITASSPAAAYWYGGLHKH